MSQPRQNWLRRHVSPPSHATRALAFPANNNHRATRTNRMAQISRAGFGWVVIQSIGSHWIEWSESELHGHTLPTRNPASRLANAAKIAAVRVILVA